MSSALEVLQFWFGNDIEGDPLQNASKWFEKNPSFDKQVTDQFQTLLDAANRGVLEEWKKTPEGTLAFILVTDQFPRNIFRGRAESFAYDVMALAAARDGVKNEFDKKLPWIGRSFFYLPFEHSENLKDQEQSTDLYEGLIRESPPKYNDYLAEVFEYAARHWEIIKRFGRFPHRNSLLNRSSTPAEVDFLKLPNSTF